MIGTGQLHAVSYTTVSKYTYTNSAGNVDTIYYAVSSGTNITIYNSVGGSGTSTGDANKMTASYGLKGTTDLVIPETLTVDETTYTVTKINSTCFANCTNLTSITLPSTVTSVGAFAFYECTALVKVSGSSGVTSWGTGTSSTNGGCFRGCTSLTSVDISGATLLGGYLFYGCTSLDTITIPSSLATLGSSAFYGCTALRYVDLSKTSVTALNTNTFNGCSALIGVKLPSSGLTSIGSSAFADCISLESFTLTSSVTSVGSSAFSGCSGLKTLTFEDDFAGSLGASCFENCTSLETISLPAKLTTFNSSLLTGCTSLKNVYFSENSEYTDTLLPTGFFNGCTALEYVYNLPKSITTIAGTTTSSSGSSSGCFYNCSALKYIDLSNVTNIQGYAFYGCKNLGSDTDNPIDLSKVKTLGNTKAGRCFYNCSSLAGNIKFNDELTYIPTYCFYGCSSLTSVDLNKVETLASYAFSGCSGLTSVALSSVETISDQSFYGCTSLGSISIPSTVDSLGAAAFYGCTSLETVTFDGSSPLTTLGKAAFAGCTSLETVTNFPSGITTLTAGTTNSGTSLGLFGNCYALTSIDISNVTTVGAYSFYKCYALQEITFNDNLTSIGASACCSCTTLTKVVIPEKVTSIDSRAFNGCSGLTEVKIYAPTLTAYNSLVFDKGNSTNSFIDGLTVYVLPYSLDDYKAGWSYSSYVIYPFSDRTVKSSTTAVTAAYPFDAYLPDGFEAYTLNFTGGSTATATAVSKTDDDGNKYLPADTPAYITYKASADTTVCFYGVNDNEVTDSCVEDNSSRTYGALVGVYASEGEYASVGDYVLQNQGSGPQFYYVNSENSALVGQFKAYLRTESSTSEAPAVLDIAFDESETTGISRIDGTTTTGTTADAVYNLQGVRMNNADSLPKGVYIRGGKKFVVK